MVFVRVALLDNEHRNGLGSVLLSHTTLLISTVINCVLNQV